MSLIIDLITKLKSERPEAKLGQQLYAIPQNKNSIIKEQVFYYYTPSRVRVAVDFTKEACIELSSVEFKKVTAKRYKELQESFTCVEDLIVNGDIYPFLLLVNGRVIKWEYIYLCCVTEKYYLLLKNIPKEYFDQYVYGVMTSKDIIMLPDNIEYKDGGFPVTSNTVFAFDNTGALQTTGTAELVIDTHDPAIIMSTGTVDQTTGAYYTISEDLKYSYFKENLFVFNNKLYDGSNRVTILGCMAKINNGNVSAVDNFTIKVFRNANCTPSYDNLSRLYFPNVKDDIKAVLQGKSRGYIDVLKEPFNLVMDKSKSYETNRSDALDLIAKYNPLYFNEYYMKEKNFIFVQVDFEWLMAHRDLDGALKIATRFENGTDFHIIMFINGELYQYYRNAKYANGYWICPLVGIPEDAKIELWYIKNAKEFALDMNISKTQPYLDLDEEYYYILNEMTIFSKLSHNTYFQFDDRGIQHFPVAHTIERNATNPDLIRVRFEQDFYYDRDLVFAARNRFVYYNYLVNLEGKEAGEYADFFKIDLEDKFMYCNEYDRYLIFYNGRRLMNDHYRLVLPCRDTTPFNRFQLYLCIPMKNGDRIDIFYLPFYFKDAYTQNNLDADGHIDIPKNTLPFALDTFLYTFWLNGKKVPMNDIANIDSNTVQLVNDQRTLRTLRATIMLTDKEQYNELKERFQQYNSKWDEGINKVTDYLAALGITKEVLTNTEPDFFSETIATAPIMKEVLRDWYIGNAEVVDLTAPFIYDYLDVDTSIVIGYDAGGNALLQGADASDAENLDVKRPYME